MRKEEERGGERGGYEERWEVEGIKMKRLGREWKG